MQSESSDDSSDSGGWIDVESGGENELSISDSDGEGDMSSTRLPDNDGPSPVEVNRTSALATTKV